MSVIVHEFAQSSYRILLLFVILLVSVFVPYSGCAFAAIPQSNVLIYVMYSMHEESVVAEKD